MYKRLDGGWWTGGGREGVVQRNKDVYPINLSNAQVALQYTFRVLQYVMSRATCHAQPAAQLGQNKAVQRPVISSCFLVPATSPNNPLPPRVDSELIHSHSSFRLKYGSHFIRARASWPSNSASDVLADCWLVIDLDCASDKIQSDSQLERQALMAC